jgi:RecB family exonuclease
MTRELIVFPTELALRRFQQELALEKGIVDASGHTTFPRLRNLCLPYLKLKGRRMNPADHLLLRRQVVEVAEGHFAGKGTLGELSRNALGEVLDQLVIEMAALPQECTRIIDWLLDQPRSHKLYQLGTIYSVWRATLKNEGLVDAVDTNLGLLKLLQGNRSDWPPMLRDCDRITFRSVRWFSPFEEACVLALNHKLKVRVESALPAAHEDIAADRLGQKVHAEIMDQPWSAWAEDLGDALAVDCPDVIQLEDTSRINFSCSAGAYGEIEDLARRICWNLTELKVPAHRIALIVPDIGKVQDIIPHVFSRFSIPYYFRRGRPVLSSPCVKAFISWLAFPLQPQRDVYIDLIRNPAIRCEGREKEVERLLQKPPKITVPTRPLSGTEALGIMNERISEPEDHFNSEALKAVEAELERIGDQTLPLGEFIDLLEELLENTTVRPRDSHEQGVWIINPHDAVGLAFDVVLFAGLNENEFPSNPQQDALLSNAERHFLRKHLEEQGRALPRLALAESTVQYAQQSVMFLSAIGMARKQLVFSCQTVDQEGVEKGAGEYFRKLWNLAGWCSRDEILQSPYDEWRLARLGEGNVFERHYEKQRLLDKDEREPMPGESFLPVIPLPVCRADDEFLQSVIHNGSGAVPTINPDEVELVPPIEHLAKVLEIEAEREAYLETEIDRREPSKYCGHIESLKEKVATWFENKGELSPTALEALARNRYVFLVEYLFGLDVERALDDTPDPMDRGSLIHSTLRKIYEAIANGEAGVDVPRCWAVKTDNGWAQRNEGGVDAIPLAVFQPDFEDEYMAFAERLAVKALKSAKLGHPGVWGAEQQKVLEQILNFIRYDAQTCAAEGRYPALFELQFGGESAVDLSEVRLKGRIDRVDLIFKETGGLSKVRVLDYKGSSRAHTNTDDYVEEIRRNLDCQLPVYAFAAQQHLFGAFNTEDANAMTESGYLFYERKFDEVGRKLKKSLIPLNEEGMVAGFLTTLSENIRRLKAGDFAVDPLLESYNDYQSLCRTDAVSLEELE